ncbi:MAG: choice-of-anchor Q domain-containing protein [Actinomycetota bacterium]
MSVLTVATVPGLLSEVAHAATAVNCPGDNLQTAINAATAGDTLDVSGHCTGNFTINKNLTLQGDGATVLDGNHTGSTVTVATGVNATLSDLTVTGGTAAFGGGIDNTGTVTVQDSTVSGNTANGASGGGIFNNAGTVTVQDSTVSGNTATASFAAAGGGIFTNTGTVTVQDSTVSGNTTNGNPAFGGGIHINGGTVTVQDSTVSGNTVNGGGVAFGGGINIGGTASVTATIVSGNSVSGAGTFGPDCNGSFTSGGYNLIGNTKDCSGFVGTDLQNVDPKLDTLKDNGGPTQTMGLLAGSPALNAIPLTAGGACMVGQTTDQRGAPRPQGVGCEIGALEKGKSTTAVGSSDTSSTSGQPVTFTATVCANPSSLPATPTGTVKFREGGTGPVLSSGVSLAPGGGTHCAQAQLTTSSLSSGRHKIVAIYSGDGANIKSRGSVIQHVAA